MGNVRFCLGSSLGGPRLPITVAGLTIAWIFLSFASEDLGRARDEPGGRMPEPTDCEKDEFEVVRDAEDVLRDSDELVEGARAAAKATELLTAVLDRGAAWFCLYGSPALSTNVFRLEGGSGTATGKSVGSCCVLEDERLEAGRL